MPGTTAASTGKRTAVEDRGVLYRPPPTSDLSRLTGQELAPLRKNPFEELPHPPVAVASQGLFPQPLWIGHGGHLKVNPTGSN